LLKTDRKQLRADFEGVAVRDDGQGKGTIVVSVQGANAYALIDRKTKVLKALVRITDGTVDGVQETDGLDVSRLSSEQFPSGFLIVQDGDNAPDTQNFKFIDWKNVDTKLP
ncbi:MAG: phytase, partial [Flavobacteriaceae bacterium]